MEGTNFNPKKIRVFYRGHGNREDFAGVRVNAVLGSGRKIPCEINQSTGLINVPASALWTNVSSAQDVKAMKAELVQSFEMTVLCRQNQAVVVAQRQGRSNAYRVANVLTGGGELVEHHVPPCGISYFDDPKSGWSVWTKPMNRENSNRIDLWLVDPDGFLELYVIYLVTLDNGATWQVVMQQRWVGNVFLRRSNTEYKLPPTADKRAKEVWNSSVGNGVLSRFVFVPGEHSEDFSSRFQIIMDPSFRAFLNGLTDLETWDDREEFWVERKPDVTLGPQQAWVKFLTYGVGRGSYGILVLEQPFEFKGRSYHRLQFDHHSVVVDETKLDEQGLVTLPPGTIVEWSDPVDMGVQTDNTPNPAKVGRVTPLYEPVAIDVRELA